MKSKILATIMLLSLALSIFAFAIRTSPVNAANENVKLTITPTPVNKVPGDVNSFFDMYVNIADVTGLFGFDINVTWTDNTLINLDYTTSNASTCTLLNGVWGVGNWFPVKSESGGGGGGGYFRVVALSTSAGFTGTNDLMNLHFQIKRSCNFILETTIHIDTFKLSDPNWQPIPATKTDGIFHIDATTPAIELVLVDPNPSKPFEYCKIFEVEVYARHICAQMTDFDLTILFNSELLEFVDVDYWGVFGTGSYISTTGSVQVTMPPGSPQTGDRLLLFALTFHVEFDDRIEHIWRTSAPHDLDAAVSIKNDVGEFSFVEGTIPITGITLPPPLTVTIHLIRGDVDCNGKVDVFDLRTVAFYYDQFSPVKYDLTMDGTIDIFDLVVVATNFGYGA